MDSSIEPRCHPYRRGRARSRRPNGAHRRSQLRHTDHRAHADELAGAHPFHNVRPVAGDAGGEVIGAVPVSRQTAYVVMRFMAPTRTGVLRWEISHPINGPIASPTSFSEKALPPYSKAGPRLVKRTASAVGVGLVILLGFFGCLRESREQPNTTEVARGGAPTPTDLCFGYHTWVRDVNGYLRRPQSRRRRNQRLAGGQLHARGGGRRQYLPLLPRRRRDGGHRPHRAKRLGRPLLGAGDRLRLFHRLDARGRDLQRRRPFLQPADQGGGPAATSTRSATLPRSCPTPPSGRVGRTWSGQGAAACSSTTRPPARGSAAS